MGFPKAVPESWDFLKDSKRVVDIKRDMVQQNHDCCPQSYFKDNHVAITAHVKIQIIKYIY